MKTIHEQLIQNREDVTGAFEANFFPREIAVCQQALRNVLAVWEQLPHPGGRPRRSYGTQPVDHCDARPHLGPGREHRAGSA